jgi:uncharacterized membrane protein
MKRLRAVALAVAGLAALALVTLVALGLRSGAGRMSASVEISAPRPLVWTWVTEPDRLKLWVGWVEDVKRRDDTHVTWIMRDENNNNARMEIEDTLVQQTPPEYVQTRMTVPGSFDGTSEFRLTALSSNRTRVESSGTFQYSHWLARLLEPLITRAAQDKLVDDLNRLKTMVEAGK